jgi:hypothetical protein
MRRLPPRAQLTVDQAAVPDPWLGPPAACDAFDADEFWPALIDLLDRVAAQAAPLNLRGGFWRDLMRVAELLRDSTRLGLYRVRFNGAVARVGDGPFDDDWCSET